MSRASRLAHAAERPAQLASQPASQGPQAPNSRAGLRAVSAQAANAHGRRLAGRLGASQSTAAACLRARALVIYPVTLYSEECSGMQAGCACCKALLRLASHAAV